MNDASHVAERFNPRSLVTLGNLWNSATEAIKVLRTHVVTRHVQEGHRALAVCAASAGVGCTFVASNLAVSLSQIGINSLLIDANMRGPAVARTFGYSPVSADIRTALSSDISFHEGIVSGILPSLSIMFCGGPAANAQELLAGPRFEALMDFCLREFDATIIDTPPANVCADARLVGKVVGYSLIVTRQNRSFVNDVKTLIQQLRGDHANVIGTVLNKN
jgi:protein-tyrosine kinase